MLLPKIKSNKFFSKRFLINHNSLKPKWFLASFGCFYSGEKTRDRKAGAEKGRRKPNLNPALKKGKKTWSESYLKLQAPIFLQSLLIKVVEMFILYFKFDQKPSYDSNFRETRIRKSRYGSSDKIRIQKIPIWISNYGLHG